MMKLKIAFVGIGSIARRHLENLTLCLKERVRDYQIDVVRSGCGKELDKKLASEITDFYEYKEKIPSDYDVIFITNPTALHYEAIQQYASSARSMFIEKPVFSDPSVELERLPLKKEGIYYVACPLRYTNVIQYLKHNVDCSGVFSARAICSSYLPEWRPGIDYRTTYSARKELGGGVSIDLIHEWDYMTYLFGFPDKVAHISGTYSKLEIDSDDCSVYIAKNRSMLYELHLDYFGRKRLRQIELFMENETVVGDLDKSEIRFLCSGETVSLNEQRNDFQKRELEHFLDILDGAEENDSSIQNALDVLKIAQAEEA